jgi:hypothetical protein
MMGTKEGHYGHIVLSCLVLPPKPAEPDSVVDAPEDPNTADAAGPDAPASTDTNEVGSEQADAGP